MSTYETTKLDTEAPNGYKMSTYENVYLHTVKTELFPGFPHGAL